MIGYFFVIYEIVSCFWVTLNIPPHESHLESSGNSEFLKAKDKTPYIFHMGVKVYICSFKWRYFQLILSRLYKVIAPGKDILFLYIGLLFLINLYIQKGAVSSQVFTYCSRYCCIRYVTKTELVLCIIKCNITICLQNWCCVFKQATSSQVFAYSCILYITRTKLMLCIQKGAISPYVFAYCCIRYITRTKLKLCIQKCVISSYVFAYYCSWYIIRTKLVLCIQKGAISFYLFAYCCIWNITRTKLVLCIQKGAISPMSLHIYCFIWYIKRTKLVWCIQKGAISPMSLHIAASDK